MAEHESGGLGVTRSIAPLYQRLPRGPHHLGPTEVARHQRLRMHGAMVEAVAANDYASTSVKQVIGLAGVSRRAFYEQFANKEECFLATFDLIAARGVKRVTRAYRATDGDLEQRIRASVEEFIGRDRVQRQGRWSGDRPGPDGGSAGTGAPAQGDGHVSSRCSPAASPTHPRRVRCRFRSSGGSWAACTRRCRCACAPDAPRIFPR